MAKRFHPFFFLFFFPTPLFIYRYLLTSLACRQERHPDSVCGRHQQVLHPDPTRLWHGQDQAAGHSGRYQEQDGDAGQPPGDRGGLQLAAGWR